MLASGYKQDDNKMLMNLIPEEKKKTQKTTKQDISKTGL